MKLLILIFLLPLQAWAADWKIRWEAAKGETECVISYEPRSLDEFVSALPAGHAEANADRKDGLAPAGAEVRLLGQIQGRKVFAVELRVEKTYYARYFLILAEVEDGRYMPIYVHQFAPGTHGHGDPVFESGEQSFSVVVSSDTHGTSPRSKRFRITCDLKSPPRTRETAEPAGPVR